MPTANSARQAPPPIERSDISWAAGLLGVEPAALAAVLTVECNWPRRKAFDSHGRLRILYEPHVAYRLLKRRGEQTILRKLISRRVGKCPLATSRWRRECYPKSNEQRWRQLRGALKCAGPIAYEFASYGLPQIMGFNYRRCGYESAEAMVFAFENSALEQLRALCKFIASSKRMHSALQKKDWVSFARLYNGPGYKRNNYHRRLANAYHRHAQTDWSHSAQEPPSHPEKPSASILVDKQRIASISIDKFVASIAAAIGVALTFIATQWERLVDFFRNLFGG